MTNNDFRAPEAIDRHYHGNGLRLHYAEWGPGEGKTTLVMVHGGRDHCRCWDDTVAHLPSSWRVIAPDLRGHGESAWAKGSSYALWDYVGDLDVLVRKLGQPKGLVLVGHSLGGAIVLQYAGARPSFVDAVVAIEPFGFGRGFDAAGLRLAGSHDVSKVTASEVRIAAHERLEVFLDSIASMEKRKLPVYRTLDDMRERLHAAHPGVPEQTLARLLAFGVRRVGNRGYTWSFDNRVRMASPYAFDLDDAREVWARIEAPALIVNGEGDGKRRPASDGLTGFLPNVTTETIPNAAHYVQLQQPEALASAITRFVESRVSG
jgi:pimeloyl-ACP methyl ester carboxylesterase